MTQDSKQKYIMTLEIGALVAFKLYSNDAKMFSGKILRISKEKVEIETKNGKKYFVDKDNITWVNTSGRWPKYIMVGLKGIGDERDERCGDEEADSIEKE